MAKIVTLKDHKTNELAYPQTVSDAVYMDNGSTLEQYKESVSRQFNNYPNVTVTGTVTNLPDNEDIRETEQHTLQLADRNNLEGMGYVILRKNKSLAEQVIYENTIYEIRYDFELSEDITIPANCVLKFDGGSINGSYYLDSDNTGIIAGLAQIFGTDVKFRTTWNIVEAYPEWFGAKGNGSNDDTAGIQAALDFISIAVPRIKKLKFAAKTYYTSSTLDFSSGYCVIEGAPLTNNGESQTYIIKTTPGIILRCRSITSIVSIGFGYANDVTIDNTCKCVLIKSTDETPGEGQYYLTDADTHILNCNFNSGYTALEIWGVQYEISHNGFSGIKNCCIDIYKYAGGNRVSGGARSYRIWYNNLHAFDTTTIFVRNNTDDGYGFSIQGTFSDTAGKFFVGKLIDSVITNNTLTTAYESIIIDSPLIKKTIINNNKFDCREQITG